MPTINVPIVPWNDPEFVAYRKESEKQLKALAKRNKREKREAKRNGK